MKDLSKFYIGSQCENICQELYNFQNNRQVDESTINTSMEIIEFCLGICNISKARQLVPQSIDEQLLPFIVELFHGKKNEEIITTFNSVFKAISCVKTGKREDVSSAISFFRNIANACLEQSIYSDRAMAFA